VKTAALPGVVAVAWLCAPAAAFAAPSVSLLVVGKTHVLRGPTAVPLRATTIRAGGKRCNVLAATPMAALARARLTLRIRDLGSCGRDPRDAGAIYVAQIGAEREAGRGGWVYKVGRRSGTTSAGDPTGPFGTGRRLRGGERVLWFWCELDRADACQRTLEATPAVSTVTAGAPLRVTVRGYDDAGRGVPVKGATVRLGGSSALTGADGVATVTAPSTAGSFRLHAEKDGLVRSFGRLVTVR